MINHPERVLFTREKRSREVVSLGPNSIGNPRRVLRSGASGYPLV